MGTDFDAEETSRSRYERLFALMTCFGSLADSYYLQGPESAFTETVVLPAFEATIQRFGARPMIVQLLPPATVADPYWDGYPGEALPLALQTARLCRPE